MNRDDRISTLLMRGYFPKELPPPFTTHKFAGEIANFSPLWAAHEAGLNDRERRNYPKPSSYARFDMARKGHSRRILGVPNPVNQYYLTVAIAEHQDEFERRSEGSPISLTPAVISRSEKRAVPMEKLSTLSEKRIYSYSTSRAILQTDVLSFYHSIYTHSIPWALHTKKLAKRNRRIDDPAYYGNKIDALIRGCQDGQTMGIPVGPDTSRIISELILCAVEDQVGPDNFGRQSGGYRYIDDFFLCFSSHVDAELFLSALRDAVLSFDLQLNANKTRIVDALSFNEERWPSDIGQLKIAKYGQDQRRDILRFFTEAIHMSKSLSDESIASYAVRKSSRTLIQRDNWEIYEAFLIRVARENSNCLESVVKIICTYAAIGYQISEKVSDFINQIIEDHAPYGHHYEIVWILWLCRSLNIRLSPRETEIVSKVQNSICACLVYMLRSRTLLTGRGAVSDWHGPVTEEDLLGEHWMLVYEAGIRKSWALPGAEAAVNANPHFRVLRDRNVSFLDTSAVNVPLQLPSIDSLLEGALNGRRSALLAGAVRAESRTSSRPRRYEKLGENYGNDEVEWAFVDPLDDLDER